MLHYHWTSISPNFSRFLLLPCQCHCINPGTSIARLEKKSQKQSKCHQRKITMIKIIRLTENTKTNAAFILCTQQVVFRLQQRGKACGFTLWNEHTRKVLEVLLIKLTAVACWQIEADIKDVVWELSPLNFVGLVQLVFLCKQIDLFVLSSTQTQFVTDT